MPADESLGLSLLVGKLEGRMESIMKMQEDLGETLDNMRTEGEASRKRLREEVQQMSQRLNYLEQIPKIAVARFQGFRAGAAFILILLGSGASVLIQKILIWLQIGGIK